MASSIVLVIKAATTSPAALVGSSSAPHASAIGLATYLSAAAGGLADCAIDAHYSTTAPVAATGTVTCASVLDADTVTVASIVLTAKTSPAGSVQWLRGVSDTADAAALVACINAHTTLSQVVLASNVAGVVTLTCKQKTILGNYIPLASSNGGRLAVSGAALAGGTGGATSTASTYRLGL